jgi:hypothetical protein
MLSCGAPPASGPGWILGGLMTARWLYDLNSWGAVSVAVALLCPAPASAECSATARAADGVKRFVVHKDEVHDRKTGLAWKRCSVGWFEYITDRCNGHDRIAKSLLSWEEAQRAAKAAGPAWRLPTKAELEGIVSAHCRTPALDESIFPDTESEWFWTSTVSVDDGIWQVFFGDGHADHFDREASPSALRLVRKAR